MSLVPRTAMAFSFLSPMITPTPRDALELACSMVAMCTLQETGAENQQIIRRERIYFRRNPIPQNLGGSSLSTQMKLGHLGVGRYSLNASSGQINLQVVPCLCVPHRLSPSGLSESISSLTMGRNVPLPSTPSPTDRPLPSVRDVFADY